MAVKIGLTIQKGGTGKSTLSICTAGALAARGNDVLLVDMDAQGFSTRTLGFRDHYNQVEPNLGTALCEPNDYDTTELIVEHDEFDILPSTIDLFGINQDLTAAGWKVRERLEMVLDQLPEEMYDFILIDAPPTLDIINDNVLLASDEVVIPVEPMESSIHALDILVDQISTLEERYERSIGTAAVVISNVHYPLDNDQRQHINYFRETFDEWCPVHEVRHRAAIKRALSAGYTIFHQDAEDCDQCEAFDALAADLETHRPEVEA